MSPKKLLLLEDDAVFRERLGEAFTRRGLSVSLAENFSRAKAYLSNDSFDYAVIDLYLPDASGMEFLKALKESCPDCRSVILTGFGTIQTTVEALKLGAVNYLTKPTHADAILQALEQETPEEVESSDPPDLPTLSQIEWNHIQRVLNECQGNVSKASKVLGLHRRSLQRKLAKYPGKLA